MNRRVGCDTKRGRQYTRVPWYYVSDFCTPLAHCQRKQNDNGDDHHDDDDDDHYHYRRPLLPSLSGRAKRRNIFNLTCDSAFYFFFFGVSSFLCWTLFRASPLHSCVTSMYNCTYKRRRRLTTHSNGDLILPSGRWRGGMGIYIAWTEDGINRERWRECERERTHLTSVRTLGDVKMYELLNSQVCDAFLYCLLVSISPNNFTYNRIDRMKKAWNEASMGKGQSRAVMWWF